MRDAIGVGATMYVINVSFGLDLSSYLCDSSKRQFSIRCYALYHTFIIMNFINGKAKHSINKESTVCLYPAVREVNV